jgi:hypothetical protein
MTSSTIRTTVVLCVAGVAAAFTGCFIHKEPSRTTTTSASYTRNDGAIEEIAAARCDRASACGNVAPGRKWDTRASCLRAMRIETLDAITRDDCPKGVDQTRLLTCASAIRSRACGDDAEPVERSAVCHKAELCRTR